MAKLRDAFLIVATVVITCVALQHSDRARAADVPAITHADVQQLLRYQQAQAQALKEIASELRRCK